MNVWDVIVLGQIPGTTVQINFTAWLFAMAVLAVVSMAVRAVMAALREELPADSGQADAPHTKRTSQLAPLTRILLNLRIRRTLAS